jgi:manganese efflux pump family protein
VVALVLPLSLDTFAVSAALGAAGVRGRERLRISLLMAGFETAMPLAGLALGSLVAPLAGRLSDLLAAGLLVLVGIWMLFAGEEGDEAAARSLGSARGFAAIGLGISISLDELAMGAGFGLLRLPLAPVLALIFAQAVLASQLGLWLGLRVGERFRERAERLAAVALIAIGAVIALLTLGSKL